MSNDNFYLPKVADLMARLEKYKIGDDFSLVSVFDEFKEIVHSHEPQLFMKGEIHRVKSERSYVTAGDLNYIDIFRTDRFAMEIYIMEPDVMVKGKHSIWTSPYDYIYAVLTPGCEVMAERYEFSPDWSVDIYDESIKLIQSGRDRLKFDSVGLVSRHKEAVRFLFEEPIAMLKLVDLQASDYQWMFDDDTLLPLMMCATQPSQSRVNMLIDVADEFCKRDYIDKETAADFFEKLGGHPMHDIRWKATQALYRVSKTRGRLALDRALSDPHPSIAKVAKNSLACLKKATM